MQIVRLESIHKKIDKKSFDCGEEVLNHYLTKYAGQNERKGLSKTYLAIGDEDNEIYGYFTISTCHLLREGLPLSQSKNLPRYRIPCVLIGKLAVSKNSQGKGIGEKLLLESFQIALKINEWAGIYAIVVDALNDSAVSFYESYGFIRLTGDNTNRLFLSIKTARKFIT